MSNGAPAAKCGACDECDGGCDADSCDEDIAGDGTVTVVCWACGCVCGRPPGAAENDARWEWIEVVTVAEAIQGEFLDTERRTVWQRRVLEARKMSISKQSTKGRKARKEMKFSKRGKMATVRGREKKCRGNEKTLRGV